MPPRPPVPTVTPPPYRRAPASERIRDIRAALPAPSDGTGPSPGSKVISAAALPTVWAGAGCSRRPAPPLGLPQCSSSETCEDVRQPRTQGPGGAVGPVKPLTRMFPLLPASTELPPVSAPLPDLPFG